MVRVRAYADIPENAPIPPNSLVEFIFESDKPIKSEDIPKVREHILKKIRKKLRDVTVKSISIAGRIVHLICATGSNPQVVEVTEEQLLALEFVDAEYRSHNVTLYFRIIEEPNPAAIGYFNIISFEIYDLYPGGARKLVTAGANIQLKIPELPQGTLVTYVIPEVNPTSNRIEVIVSVKKGRGGRKTIKIPGVPPPPAPPPRPKPLRVVDCKILMIHAVKAKYYEDETIRAHIVAHLNNYPPDVVRGRVEVYLDGRLLERGTITWERGRKEAKYSVSFKAKVGSHTLMAKVYYNDVAADSVEFVVLPREEKPPERPRPPEKPRIPGVQSVRLVYEGGGVMRVIVILTFNIEREDAIPVRVYIDGKYAGVVLLDFPLGAKSSSKTFRVPEGRHTVRVTVSYGGVTKSTSITYTYKVIRVAKVEVHPWRREVPPESTVNVGIVVVLNDYTDHELHVPVTVKLGAETVTHFTAVFERGTRSYTKVVAVKVPEREGQYVIEAIARGVRGHATITVIEQLAGVRALIGPGVIAAIIVGILTAAGIIIGYKLRKRAIRLITELIFKQHVTIKSVKGVYGNRTFDITPYFRRLAEREIPVLPFEQLIIEGTVDVDIGTAPGVNVRIVDYGIAFNRVFYNASVGSLMQIGKDKYRYEFKAIVGLVGLIGQRITFQFQPFIAVVATWLQFRLNISEALLVFSSWRSISQYFAARGMSVASRSMGYMIPTGVEMLPEYWEKYWKG